MGQVVPLERARSYRQVRSSPAEPRLTGRQLCNVLAISDSTLKRWRKRGLPAESWGAGYRYVLSDVFAWRLDTFGV